MSAEASLLAELSVVEDSVLGADPSFDAELPLAAVSLLSEVVLFSAGLGSSELEGNVVEVVKVSPSAVLEDTLSFVPVTKSSLSSSENQNSGDISGECHRNKMSVGCLP